jgi:hypothetical protein
MTAKLGKDFVAEQEVNFAISDSIQTKGIDVDEFYKQLMDFYNDKSYQTRFEKCSLTNKIGIEIFRFQPNKNIKSKLLTVDLTGSLLSVDNVFESTHIAKVVKLPNDNLHTYKEGDLVIMSYADTVGQDINPDYAFLMQFSQGNLEPKMAKSVPPITHRYVSKLFDNVFLPPHEFNTKSENVSTFAVEPFRIIGKYEI